MRTAQSLFIARISRGWSQQELANLVGLTQTTISHLETGRTAPKVQTRHSLESVLGTIDWRVTKSEAIIRKKTNPKLQTNVFNNR